MAYDNQSDRIAIFGGNTGEHIDETWAYDFASNTWTNRSPVTKPSARSEHAMAYDSQSDRIVLFGGWTGGGGDRNGETWAYDFETNTWTNLNPTPKPAARYEHAMAYDSQSDRVLLFGGFSGAISDETWAYNFETNTWTNLNPATKPSGRYGHSMAYDSQSDRIVLFGGLGESAETWAYDFEANTWTNMNPTAKPSRRVEHAMAYDSGSDRVLLFGGRIAGTGDQNDETWAYDFESNTWTNMNPSPKPSARSMHALAYDSGSDRVLLFGGWTGENSDETWSYNFEVNTWTKLEPSPIPPSEPRNLQAMAGDAQVTLTWQPPFSDGGSPITGYEIHRGTAPGSESFLVTVGIVLTYQDTGLTNGVTYYYRVSAMNGEGESERSNEVSATPRALAIAASASPASGAAPLAVSFTTTVTGGLAPYSYAWAFGDGGTSSLANPTHTYATAGTYTATVVVTDAEGGQRTAEITVTALLPLAVQATADATAGTIPFTVSFHATPSGGSPPYSFLWGFGDGTTSTVQNPSHTYSAEGTYAVTLTVTDAEARTMTRTIEITASSPSVPVAGAGIPPWVLYVAVASLAAVAAGVGVLLWRRRKVGQLPPPPPPR